MSANNMAGTTKSIRRISTGRVVGVAFLVVILAVIGTVVTLVLTQSNQEVPTFPSLIENPDPTLQGTIAYSDETTGCIRLILVSGAKSKDLYCPDTEISVPDAEKFGKPTGPQLIWLEDGRLEATWFRMTDPPGPDLRPGWQVIIDVTTGDVEETPEADVPTAANLETRPMTSADGVQIGYVSDSLTGEVEVFLTEPDGTSRTLFTARGPEKYTYGVVGAFWSPGDEWIVVDDGRILIVTVGVDVQVRELVDHGWASGFGEELGRSTFAITSDNLL